MQRLTAQRQAILDLINASSIHWDAEAVARALADSGHSVGIATIYRGLSALAAEGLIESIQLADKKRYERADKSHHDHMVCTGCGRIEEFAHETIEALQHAAANEKGFVISGHQLVMFGLCADCVKEKP
jgi:Fur family ferric uptake transcriptional regulator